MKWRHWKDDCQRRMDEGEFATNRNLEMVARVNKHAMCSCSMLHEFEAQLIHNAQKFGEFIV